MSDKLNINNEMRQFDLKRRDFYDSLTDEERKKFSNYLMIRWGSAVHGSVDLQEFYVIATNERLNKNFFAISKHPKLQWLCATTVSPGLGSQRHQWIAPKKKVANNDTKKLLTKLYPVMKPDDVEILSKLITKEEVKQLAHDNGIDLK